MDYPLDPPREQPTLDLDIPDLKALAGLFVQAKALILYSEEVEPDSRSNLHVIKGLRDALEDLMRIIVGTQATAGASDTDYASRKINKSIGHIVRTVFDALDGTVMSLRVKITQVVDNYPLEVLNQVITNYWEINRSSTNSPARSPSTGRARPLGPQLGRPSTAMSPT